MTAVFPALSRNATRVQSVSLRSNALAERLERGAVALTQFAEGLSDNEWAKPTPHDGRTVGVIVHHVATMYPLEIELALQLAKGEAIENVTWTVVATINAAHAQEYEHVTKREALELLARNSADAAQAIRQMTDSQLDGAANVSLYADAPLTCQFFLEDHAVRHSYHHLARLRLALGRE